jgi:hypothetical protein
MVLTGSGRAEPDQGVAHTIARPRLVAGHWREPTGAAANDIGAENRQAAGDQMIATRLPRSEL